MVICNLLLKGTVSKAWHVAWKSIVKIGSAVVVTSCSNAVVAVLGDMSRLGDHALHQLNDPDLNCPVYNSYYLFQLVDYLKHSDLHIKKEDCVVV